MRRKGGWEGVGVGCVVAEPEAGEEGVGVENGAEVVGVEIGRRDMGRVSGAIE